MIPIVGIPAMRGEIGDDGGMVLGHPDSIGRGPCDHHAEPLVGRRHRQLDLVSVVKQLGEGWIVPSDWKPLFQSFGHLLDMGLQGRRHCGILGLGHGSEAFWGHLDRPAKGLVLVEQEVNVVTGLRRHSLGLKLRDASQPSAAGHSNQAKGQPMGEVLHNCIYAYMRMKASASAKFGVQGKRLDGEPTGT